jgi:hypothetical protein
MIVRIAGILLCLGAAAAISLSQSKVDEAPSAPIEDGRELHRSGITGLENQFEHAGFSTAQAQKRPMI